MCFTAPSHTSRDFTSTSTGQGSSVCKTLRQPLDGPCKGETPLPSGGKKWYGPPYLKMMMTMLGPKWSAYVWQFQAGKHPRNQCFKRSQEPTRVFSSMICSFPFGEGGATPKSAIWLCQILFTSPRNFASQHYFLDMVSLKIPFYFMKDGKECTYQK